MIKKIKKTPLELKREKIKNFMKVKEKIVIAYDELSNHNWLYGDEMSSIMLNRMNDLLDVLDEIETDNII